MVSFFAVAVVLLNKEQVQQETDNHKVVKIGFSCFIKFAFVGVNLSKQL